MRGRALDLMSAALCVVAGWSRASDGPPPASAPAPREEVVAESDPKEIGVEAVPSALTPNQELARAVAAETEAGRWDRDALARIRALLRERTLPDARDIMRLAGFDARSAKALGRRGPGSFSTPIGRVSSASDPSVRWTLARTFPPRW